VAAAECDLVKGGKMSVADNVASLPQLRAVQKPGNWSKRASFAPPVTNLTVGDTVAMVRYS